MEVEGTSSESPGSQRDALRALLDDIESAIAGGKDACADEDLQALRAELTRHIDGETWFGGTLGEQARNFALLYESGLAIRRRLHDLRDALHVRDAIAATACVTDLRDMIAAHLELERLAVEALRDGGTELEH